MCLLHDLTFVNVEIQPFLCKILPINILQHYHLLYSHDIIISRIYLLHIQPVHIFNFRNLQDNLTMIHILQNLSESNSIKLLDSHLPIPCTHHVSKVDIQPTTKSHLSVDLFAESRQSCLI